MAIVCPRVFTSSEPACAFGVGVCALRDSDVKVRGRWLNVTKVVDQIRPDFVVSGKGRRSES